MSALLDLLQLFFRYIWVFLIPAGLFGLVLRPLVWVVRRKKTTSHRVKNLLWFLQALGFWALLIGSWMRFEGVIADLLEDDGEVRRSEVQHEKASESVQKTAAKKASRSK